MIFSREFQNRDAMKRPLASHLSGPVKSARLLFALLLYIFFTRTAMAETTFCDIDPDQVLVESSREVDKATSHRMQISDFNAIIAEVPVREESWVKDPVRVVLEYLGTPGARAVTIRRCDASGEAATETSVTLVEDGYADDSVRGTWYHFRLERDVAGHWLIKEGREAYRCWRGDHTQDYSEKNCP